MSRTGPVRLLAFLVAVVAILGGAAMARGAFYVGMHVGDLLHAVEIIVHMAEGRWPSLDFMTPIGVLAFAPIALFVQAGLGLGMSMLAGQVLVAAALLPLAWWAAWTRFGGVWAYAFGLVLMVLVLALIHGDASRTIAFSMHYNRWAWAIAFVALAVAMLPPLGRAPQAVDGLVVGVCMAALALIKVTYFAAFALPVAVGLIAHRRGRALAAAAGAGLAVAALVTAAGGVEYWAAYLADLRAVSASEVRERPGETFAGVLGAPRFLGATVALLAGVMLLRQAGRAAEGLVLLLLVPGFAFVTYQNWGNDPQWLMFLAVVLMALRPGAGVVNGWGWDLRQALTVTGVAAMALTAPSFLNTVQSPFHHLRAETRGFVPLVPGRARFADLLVPVGRAWDFAVRLEGEVPEVLMGALPEAWEAPAPTVFLGEVLPDCEAPSNPIGQSMAYAAELERAGFAGTRVMGADIFAAYWLYGDIAPLPGGAPWYYGGLPGIAAADYVLVPYCPAYRVARAIVLRELEATGMGFDEVLRTGDFVLYRPRR